jgi:hypothetical protein
MSAISKKMLYLYVSYPQDQIYQPKTNEIVHHKVNQQTIAQALAAG